MLSKKGVYTMADIGQVIHFGQLVETVEKLEDRDLAKIMKMGAGMFQPILSFHLGQYSGMKQYKEQVEDLTRITLLIWQYYDPLLPPENTRVERALYEKMAARQKEWVDSFSRLSEKASGKKLSKRVFEHPSGILMRTMYEYFIVDPYRSIGKLSFEERSELLSSFSVILDCFEYVRAEVKQDPVIC